MERARAGLERVRRCRWADVGRSVHPDPSTAGREAARAALGGRADAGLLLVFASGALALEPLAAAVAAEAGDAAVVGCSSAAELDASGPADRSVVVLALGGDGLTFSAAAVPVAGDPRDAGARAAACIGDVADRKHQVLLLLADGPPQRQPQIVRGAYSVAGAGVPLVGGVAGHPSDGPGPAVLLGGEVHRDTVVGVAIGSDAPIGVGARHGWEPAGEPMLVTRARDGRVHELDGRPAAEVYRERLGGRQPFAVTLTRPLGVLRREGEGQIVFVRDDDAPDGSLECALAGGAMAWLMESDPERVLGAADAACEEALAALGDAPPRAVVAFDCNARRQFLGAAAADEVARVAHHAGAAAVAGVFTWGEIARTRGSAGFHQQTLVVLALA